MKRSFLIVVCVLALLAVWRLWPSGGRSAAVAKKIVVAPASPAAVITKAAVTNNFAAVPEAVSRSAASTNREFFRLANTSKTLGELTTAPRAILLENALVDTTAKTDLKIPAHLRAASEPGAYIVQARGVVDAPFRAALANAGAQIVSYIPNNAYLVQLSAGGAAVLQGNAEVAAVLPFAPYFKLQSSLLGLAVAQKALPPEQVLTLGLFASGAGGTVAQIEKMGGIIVATDRSPFGPVVRVRPPANWIALAQLPGVQRVEPATRRVVANDLARVTMGISVDTLTNANWLGLSGSNVLVEVNDTGIDETHPDFTTGGSPATGAGGTPIRVTGDTTNSLVDTDGHGTHVAGIIAGNGDASQGKGGLGGVNVGANARGSVTNADFRGKAPAAKLFSFGFLGANDTNVFYSDALLQEIPALTNALISNNSWINDGANEYDLSAASYDAAVRDALPERTGPQPVLFVFAAGNDGGGSDDGSGGSSDTILSPATAKNVVTVGALEQYRDITNTYTPLNSTNQTAAWQAETSSSSQVAGFSARGNVGVQTEGTFGRFKPDVVAPGVFVVSTRPTGSMWDQQAYYNPTNYDDSYSGTGLLVDTNTLAYGFALVPSNAVSVTIRVVSNAQSPTPLPNLPIYFSATSVPDPTDPATYDFIETNSISIPPQGNLASLLNGGFNCTIAAGTNQTAVNFDLIIEITETNQLGNQLTVLSNLNNTLAPYYRYETGTSMAAPAVSGALALLQDFFTNTLKTTPSPALLKAMVINGARLTSGYNFYGVTNTINYEGWGLVNVPNSVPLALTNTTSTGTNNTVPMYFLDQSQTNALATGGHQTFNVSVPTALARAQPLRVTLAWTDPPGNPAAGIKLVNNLDLVVTNNSTGDVFYGNNFVSGQNPHSVASNSNSVPDNINNVENVILQAPLGTNYSVTVNGRNVTVNAVTLEQTNIVQDYALVISCGDGANTNGITVTTTNPVATVSSITPNVTFVSATNGVYYDQLAGANAPWLSTNAITFGTNSIFTTNANLYIGQTNQWHFFVVTNTTTYTNAAFIIFLPATLATPREGVFADSTANSTRPEADLDLFVASEPSLTNLDSVVISNCVYGANGDQASLTRGGTKFIVYSNALPGEVYYVGVQCEDQMAADFGFLPIFSQNAFSQIDSNGNQVVTGQLLPATIPDGDNAHPGHYFTLGLATFPMTVGGLTVSNTIATENYGDLLGVLTHDGAYATLNNHTGPTTPGTYTAAYNDDGLPGTTHTDGPGSLRDFRGQQAIGPWILTEVDDSAGLTGAITSFTLVIQPHLDLTKGFQNVTVQPLSWYYGYVDVPVGYTNMTVVATNYTLPYTPPIQLYLNYNVEPDFANYLVYAPLTNGIPPGNIISYGPPLTPGRYFVGLYNPDIIAHTVGLGVTLAFNAAAISTLNFPATGPVPLQDDAVTNESIFVANTDPIQAFNVGLRVDHQRISDLVFHLISPDGTRFLLMENRGGQTTNGCGATLVTTNVTPVSSSGGPAATTNLVNVGRSSGPVTVNWNFFAVPDTMDIYYEGVLVFSSGLVSYTGTTNLNFGPGVSTQLEVVMNATNHPSKTYWNYTIGGVQTNYYYLSFTEDTNLTTTPIKFATPPFVPQTAFSAALTDSFEAYPLQTYAQSSTFGGWTVATNQVEIVTNPPAYDGLKFLQLDNGVVFTNVPTVPGQKYVLTYALGSSLTDGTGPATNANWQLESYVFTATSASTPLVLAASSNALAGLTFTNAQTLVFSTNALLDDFLLQAAAGNLYYQPEQDLSPLIGTSPYGTWTLEVLDNRAGATNNANLVSWNLGFTFANTNFTSPTITITNSGPQTNYIPGHSLAWYLVNVPTNADFATNFLSVISGPSLNLRFSTNAPPTITNTPGDVQLLSVAGTGTAVLGTSNSPVNLTSAYIIPGGSYYLGVQNTNNAGATYAVDVTFHYLPSAPLVLTLPATAVLATNATLNAAVFPDALNTTVYFEYGLDTNYGAFSASAILTNNLTSTNFVATSVTNLVPGAIYHFQAIGANALGTNYGGDLTFTNLSGGSPPYAFTAPATLAKGASAQLNGFATPNGSPATAWFEWGTSTGYGVTTPPVAVGTNYNVVFVTNQIAGLTTNLPYHFRLVVSNALGVVHGFDQIFDQANVVAWGANFFGQATPLPTSLTNLVVGIGAGYDFSLAVNNDGTVAVWGDNTFGQTNVPAGLNNAVAVSGGEKDSLALRSDRTVLVWGSNQFHQTNVPPSLTNAVAVASGGFHCIALDVRGNPVVWGYNGSGQTNVPAGLSNVVAVAGGDLHSLALKNDGTVVAWGYNDDGETNVPAGLSNVVAISAGEYHNLALKSDGTVVAWGDNADGETTVPAGLTNVIAISGGGFHSLALTSDGIVHAWGDNSANQTTVPLSLSNVVAIAGGGLHSLALSSIYGLNQTNNAPFWTNGLAGSTRTMNELTTLLVTNTATDTNFPPQTLSYALTNLLAWVSINSQGVITLLPQEADGPSTNIISTVVTDNGHPALSATNSFTLIVNEVNLAPYWPTNVPSQTNYVIGVSNLLTVTNTASDSDLPTNSLTYTNWVSPAANPPAISTNGIITWTPQSVGTFVITNVVTDYNPWALTNQNLSATNYFTVTVTNAPTPPPNAISIASIIYTNITGTNGFLLTWFAPSNDLFKVQWTASLAPTSWNTFTNIISYNPNITPVNPTNAQFNFFDDGSQFPFGTTRFYRLLLLNSLSNTPPVLPLQTNQTIFALTTLVVTNTAMDSDLPAQTLTYVLVNPSSGAAIDANGVITWTPTVNQALTNYTFTTVVTDSGTPPLSATNSFVVTVKPAVLGLTNATFFYLGAITTDGTNLYAVNAGGNPQTNYVISISLPFNTNSLVAPTYANVDISSSLNGLATHGTNLFWIDPNANPPPSGGTTTFRGDKNGGPITVYNDPGTIFDGSDLTADSSQLFAVDYQGGKVTRLAFDFSSEISIGAARYFGPERLNTLTVANGTVYVADSAGSVVSLSTNGGSYTSVYVGAPLIYPDGIAANAGALFVVDSGATNTIWMLPISGGTPVPLLSGLPFRVANRITYWNHALYVTDNNAHGTNGIIWQVSLPNPSPVVSGVSVATNGMNLSWTAPIYDQFQVEWTTNLTPVVSWNVLPNIITSTNGAFSFTDTNVVSGMKFYRLLLLP